jgi:NTP pyrophosphatase (non-canonical NTP hydrolase)
MNDSTNQVGQKMETMSFEQYQELSQRTANKDMELSLRLAVAGLGITGEAGEVADIIKKHIGHGHPLNIDGLGKELGDVMWYLSEISYIIGYPLGLIAKDNIEKLKKRYPQGFSSERSINREE